MVLSFLSILTHYWKFVITLGMEIWKKTYKFVKKEGKVKYL